MLCPNAQTIVHEQTLDASGFCARCGYFQPTADALNVAALKRRPFSLLTGSRPTFNFGS